MMNNFVVTLLVSAIFYATFSNLSYAKQPEIKWSKTNTSLGLRHAKLLQSSGDLPDSATELLRRVNISINKGVVTKTVSRVSYLPTFTQAQDDGTKYIYWDEATTDLTLTEASVVLPNGQSVRMDSENIRVRNSDQYNTFTNNKEVLIPMSGITDGAMIVLEYEEVTQLGQLESLYSEVIYPVNFQENVSLFELSFEHDSDIDMDWANDTEVVKCNYAKQRLKCEGRDIEKLPYDNGMVWRDTIPTIVIAQKADWKHVVKHVETAFNKSDYESQDVRNLALKLTEKIENLEDKIHALHTFASRSIRYVSMSELGHRITPHNFADVVKNLFGDCKDKSALLVGMLRAIGIDAFPVLVATERRNPAKLKIPSSTYFDHMVVCFDKDEKRFCLDPTNTATSWHKPASWIQGRVALELRGDSQPKVIPLDDYKWTLDSEILMTFDRSANVSESQTRIFQGPYAGEMRASLLTYDEEKRQEALQENYHDNVSNLVEPEFKIKFLDTQSSNLEINSKADYEPYYNKDQDLSLSEYDSWIRAELNNNKATAENYGAWVDGTHMKSRMVYDFGGLWKISRLPAELKFNDDIANLRRTSKVHNDGTIEVNTELRIKSHFLEAQDITNYNNMIDVLLKASNIQMKGTLTN